MSLSKAFETHLPKLGIAAPVKSEQPSPAWPKKTSAMILRNRKRQ